MQIFVRNVDGVTNTLEVESSNTIADVRAKIQHKLGNLPIPSELVCFKFAGKVLDKDDDDNTLAAFNIHGGSMLDLMTRLRGGGGGNQVLNVQRNKEKNVQEKKWLIYVYATPTEHYHSIDVDKHTTVDDVRTAAIHLADLSVKEEGVMLSCTGRVLEDGTRTLKSYKIKGGFCNPIQMAWNVEEEEDEKRRKTAKSCRRR